LFWERYSFGIKGKIEIAKDFLYGMDKVRKIKFDTLKWKVLNIRGVYAKVVKLHEGK
jgi:hypothetical protein